MKIKLSKSEITCVSLEKELGLMRGDIEQINTLDDGSVEVDTAKALTAAHKTKLETILGMKEVW